MNGLWLIPALPLAGFFALILGRKLPPKPVALIGVGSVAASMIVTLFFAIRFISAPPPGGAVSMVLWRWINVGGFSTDISLYLDALSLVMALVVTVVGFLIHLYSTAFMSGDEGYARFFSYMNLFVGSMLILVLAGDFLLLYLGWEGVGLCSYLLIGFWYRDPANGHAAMKAFIVTRIGDTLMAIGLFVLFANLHTLQIQDVMRLASEHWAIGSGLAVASAALLLGGALGKSAQLPLHTWLPDAMAGPSPVSALIHAATMVTAGVYLIARTHALFSLAPAVQFAVAVIGAATLLVAGFSALTQQDIKRVLAYSTISQIGYMFLALGVGAWSAALYHFFTHALFKSLLFLAAGVVIVSMHHEHNMFKMGGLRKELPLAFWTFLIGAFALSSLPPVTAGFSKELILVGVWHADGPVRWLWGVGIVGAFLTSMYTFRMVFLTFFGASQGKPVPKGATPIAISLVLLSVGCLLGGLLQFPKSLGGVPFFTSFMHSALPSPVMEQDTVRTETILGLIAEAAAIGGLIVACVLFLYRPAYAQALAGKPIGSKLCRFWFAGWGLDWLYDKWLVEPFVRTARGNRDDVVDSFYHAVARMCLVLNFVLSRLQTGHVRWYATGLAVGAIIALGIVALK